jgi:hypothetical protein
VPLLQDLGPGAGGCPLDVCRLLDAGQPDVKIARDNTPTAVPTSDLRIRIEAVADLQLLAGLGDAADERSRLRRCFATWTSRRPLRIASGQNAG